MGSDAGKVYLVGGGPGDVGLLSLRAAELLGRADLVVYDALVSPGVLRLVAKSAEKIYAGKRSRKHAIPQADLNRLLIAKAREGKTVVRLKGGDPYIFGRGGEEAEELHDAGVAFEVVPGISSIVAAANYAGIPLTHRDYCSAFTVITGHENPGKETSRIQWDRFARVPGTKVILMGVEHIAQICDSLTRYGMDPATPAAMIQWGTTGRQRTVCGTLATLRKRAGEAGFSSPAVTVVGEVIRLRAKLNWFEKRPLFGQRIVVTRTRAQAGKFSQRLIELGAEVVEIPAIRIQDPGDKQPVAEVMADLGGYDWLVFTSSNGVSSFFEYFFRAFDDIRGIGNVRIAAVGTTTAAMVRKQRLRVDAVPREFRAVHVAEAIGRHESLENLRILIARAQVANPELPRLLEEKGAIVDDVAFYQTIPASEEPDETAQRFLAEGADWITFTSGSTVANFDRRFHLADILERYPALRCASVGPETSRVLEGLGVHAAVQAQPHTIEGLISALVASLRSGPGARRRRSNPRPD